ncbi:DUF3302 domain-containing protein [Enterobacter sp. CC120223-11]|uniref:DUF3302 domain-containing protein n=1 Tax=Enterobacter sp. CC120223-11 TaxID=1378073 RepID=UPI000BD29E13|nr:DUF3302 domain-containing protein [Enterobacter sp. CC120223-11]SNY61511.1 Protein of unknown function [Enterobacter sp. CC120223-11]
MTLDYVALAILTVVLIVFFYGIIAIHDIPYDIAKKRNHPHQDAIHYAGWVSLFTLHALWPFLWIWATLWREDRGWGMNRISEDQQVIHQQMNHLLIQVENLKNEISQMKSASPIASAPAVTQEEK